MNPTPGNDDTGLPIYDAGEQSTYSLDIIAEITGVASQTILHYQEHGLIPSTSSFDDETVHALRRIEHLRSTCEPNLAGLKLILELTEQVERLKAALRAHH